MTGQYSRAAGFTLLEIILTLGILMSMMFAVSSMMQGSFDVRTGLSQDARVTNRLIRAMDKISDDLQHAFVYEKNDPRNFVGRRYPPVFRIETRSSSKLMMTVKNHKPIRSGAKQSNLSYVVYEIRPDPDNPGWTHLYRGESKVLPEDYKEEPPMQVFARYIQSVRFQAWRGDDWERDNWDTTRGSWRDSLPQMVKVEIRAFPEDPVSEGERPEDDESQLVTVSSIVRLSQSIGMEELKQPTGSIRWDYW